MRLVALWIAITITIFLTVLAASALFGDDIGQSAFIYLLGVWTGWCFFGGLDKFERRVGEGRAEAR